jgi:hypothetical protein
VDSTPRGSQRLAVENHIPLAYYWRFLAQQVARGRPDKLGAVQAY